MTTLADHIRHEHKQIHPHLDSILTAAHAVGEVPRDILIELVHEVYGFLVNELLPHARQEDTAIYMAVEQVMGSAGATNSMKREHVGIKSYVDELSELHGSLIIQHQISESTIRSLRRVLYGIHAIVMLHLTVEEDVYLPLLDTLPLESQEKLLANLKNHGG